MGVAVGVSVADSRPRVLGGKGQSGFKTVRPVCRAEDPTSGAPPPPENPWWMRRIGPHRVPLIAVAQNTAG